MIARSEPLLLPLFFTFCIHFGLLLLFGYWSNWQAEDRMADPVIGPSLQATLTVSSPVIKPAPPVLKAPPIVEKAAPKPQQEPEPQVIEEQDLAFPKESTLDNLIENLKKIAPAAKEEVTEPVEPVEKKVSPQPAAADTEQQDLRREALAYYHRNQLLVERNFNPGTSAQRKRFQGLVTRLKIFLDEQGRLVGVEIVSSSGNAVFDVEAERAVRRTHKFIVPADAQLRELYFRAITMEFSLTP